MESSTVLTVSHRETQIAHKQSIGSLQRQGTNDAQLTIS